MLEVLYNYSLLYIHQGFEKRVFDVVPDRELEQDSQEALPSLDSSSDYSNAGLKKLLKMMYQRIRRQKSLDRKLSPIFGL